VPCATASPVAEAIKLRLTSDEKTLKRAAKAFYDLAAAAAAGGENLYDGPLHAASCSSFPTLTVPAHLICVAGAQGVDVHGLPARAAAI